MIILFLINNNVKRADDERKRKSVMPRKTQARVVIRNNIHIKKKLKKNYL